MAVDAFLKLGDVKGESPVEGFEDQIQVLSWSWGMSQTGTTHTGTGGGAGKVNVQDMAITHYVDTASPNIIMACASGKHYPEAVLTLRKAGEDALEYLTITLNDLIITSVSMGGSEGEERNTESFTLNFSKFKYSYQPQDSKGAKKGGAIDYEADISKGKFK
jgi:type VI secretion system secreted protein Hcp